MITVDPVHIVNAFLVPKWFLAMTNAFTLLQLATVGVVTNTSLDQSLP